MGRKWPKKRSELEIFPIKDWSILAGELGAPAGCFNRTDAARSQTGTGELADNQQLSWTAWTFDSQPGAQIGIHVLIGD